MTEKAKIIYLASDFHLGAPNMESSREREKIIVSWLDEVSKDATDIFLVGDVFDFWFEYSQTVPKGFTRILGKIALLSDSGIQFHFFKGNHDMWTKDYFKVELGFKIYSDPIQVQILNSTYLIGHGDGLGPSDISYKILKRILRSRIFMWAFARVHPNLGIRVANFFSGQSRRHGGDDSKYNGPEQEWLYTYAAEKLKKEKIDFFIFGHRHLPLQLKLQNSTYFNLGEWIQYRTFLRIDSNGPQLLEWKDGSFNPFQAHGSEEV